MAARGGERRVLTVGGKGFSLSSASVFDFSSNGYSAQVKIDPSALTRLSSSLPSCTFHFSSSSSVGSGLTPEEARASLLVLLNKLLLSGSSISLSSAAASQLLDALNKPEETPSSILDRPILVTQDDLVLLNNSWPDAALHGVCALLDYISSSLSTVADAVASLSCEALGADVTSSFNLLTDSGDGSSAKDAVAVASDFKVLLNGSKLLGKFECDQVVSSIPKVHGRLRAVSRSVHSTTRVELSSSSSPIKGGANSGTGEDLVALLSSLALALQNLGKSSWHRARLCSLNNNSLGSIMIERFNAGCPPIDSLDYSVKSFLAAYFENDFVSSLHQIYCLSDTVRKILSWEAMTSFLSLEGTEVLENSRPRENINAAKPEKKKDRRKKVMGKGTTVLLQFIKDRLQSETFTVADGSALVDKLAQDFLSLLDPKDPGFECLLQKVKDVVDSNESRRLPKLPKGTRDFAKEQMAVREKAFSIIGEVFKRHGAMALDTPVFEMRETLTGKYGEDSKLIYDLADQGGELCSLRYDLTVPFARYVAMNGLTSFRRYQIAKVYRRDNPSKGRYREFYQCDFDIAGDETVGADFEVVKILTELLDELNIGDYKIKLNHRKLLDGMLEICGVPSSKVRTICSSIDKLDKQSFEHIKREMVDEKGLNSETVDQIGSFVMLNGHPLELLPKLKQERKFLENQASNDAIKDLEKLFKALENAGCIDKVVLDLSLARGLDYYTGVIFEAVFEGATQVGSIAAGGRYDNLIGMFGTKHVHAVGVSLGIERVFTIMEQLQNQAVRATETQILVCILGDDIYLAAKLVGQCWDAKLKAEFMVHKRFAKHLERAKTSRIPFMVIVGERELNEGIVKLKDLVADKEEPVPISEFVEELLRRLKSS